jgi:hypothetical protein
MKSKYSNYAVFLNKGNNVKTKCYTYEVTMLVQVLADDETNAAIQLDDKGGYVSDRKVKLVKTIDLGNKPKSVKE